MASFGNLQIILAMMALIMINHCARSEPIQTDDCSWIYGDAGEDLTCGRDQVPNGMCGTMNLTKSCGGKDFGLYCCKLVGGVDVDGDCPKFEVAMRDYESCLGQPTEDNVLIHSACFSNYTDATRCSEYNTNTNMMRCCGGRFQDGSTLGLDGNPRWVLSGYGQLEDNDQYCQNNEIMTGFCNTNPGSSKRRCESLGGEYIFAIQCSPASKFDLCDGEDDQEQPEPESG